MSHNHLLELHGRIRYRLQDARNAFDASQSDPFKQRLAQGRIDVLVDFRRFLSDNFDIKLPRRLYRRLQEHGIDAVCRPVGEQRRKPPESNDGH